MILPYSGTAPLSVEVLALEPTQGVRVLIRYTAEELVLFYNHPASMYRC